MHKVVTTAQMREIDRLTTEKHGIPSLQLMENAAQSVSDLILAKCDGVTGRSVLVLCGPGNNGGDGAVIARMLLGNGARVVAVLAKKLDATRGDARTNLEELVKIRKSGAAKAGFSFLEIADEPSWSQFTETHSNEKFDVVVDALFGTGLTRPLAGVHGLMCDYINSLAAQPHDQRPWIISVDIPSGLNSDTPFPIGPHVRAETTVTFTAPKLANVMPPADRDNGELLITQIGSPKELVEAQESEIYLTQAADARAWLKSTRYTPGSFKNSHGHALIIAGSRDYLGAPVLCGDAAMQSGAGLVTVATPASALFGVAPRLMPEVITAALAETDGGAVSLEAKHQVEKLAQRADVMAAGPGLTASDEGTRSFMRWLVENRRQPLVIDADGLNALATWPIDLKGTNELPIVLTPHPGEMRRLLGVDELGEEPWKTAAEFAVRQHLIVVLKGERTVLISPAGEVFINPTGNPGVGTAGAGDTMTGVIAGFFAQALATKPEQPDVLTTVQAAVYLCGMAADLAADHIGMRAMTASDIRSHLGAAICELAPDTEFP